MDVAAHDRVGEATPVRCHDRRTQQRQIPPPFDARLDEPIARGKTRDDVIDAAGTNRSTATHILNLAGHYDIRVDHTFANEASLCSSVRISDTATSMSFA